MQIEIGVNPNCSEIVSQVCGVTKPIADQLKERFKEILFRKYKKEYLDDYAAGVFAIEGKYCLNLYDYDGHDTPDWGIIVLAAEEMGLDIACVSCCSTPIDTDKQMEEHIKWQQKQKEKESRDK